jgi:hypothetical protein
VAPEVRDAVVDWVQRWSLKSGFSQRQMLRWLDLQNSRFHDWQRRFAQGNRHNANLPRSGWLLDWEAEAILDFHACHPREGYRRLTYMMLDKDIAAVSPSSVYRVLNQAGLLRSRWAGPCLKGKGFEQPLQPHEHWHVDVSYINIHATCQLPPGVVHPFSAKVVHLFPAGVVHLFSAEVVHPFSARVVHFAVRQLGVESRSPWL